MRSTVAGTLGSTTVPLERVISSGHLSHGHERRRFPPAISIHLIVDNAPQTWDTGPRRFARPMLHLLPYPRRRRAHQPAVSRTEARPRQGL